MVLAGTTLTALFSISVFSDFSLNLGMTMGSILSATDPVAVSALLNEVGAPPRLKTHVAGESLLNDGAAIVFFFIFKDRFLHELGVGEDVGWGAGVKSFLRKSTLFFQPPPSISGKGNGELSSHLCRIFWMAFDAIVAIASRSPISGKILWLSKLERSKMTKPSPEV